jgi:ribosome-associated toxin RatA of RatAB toxin-antitoxin module
MAIFEYIDTFDYPASAVFALLTDLSARPDWIQGTYYEIRVTPEGPARPGTSYFESARFSGFKSEKTLLVTEFEQDRLLTLASENSAQQPWRESYRIEPLSEGTCRVHFTVDVGNVPKMAEFFMRNQMKKDQPQNAARLKSLLAARG